MDIVYIDRPIRLKAPPQLISDALYIGQGDSGFISGKVLELGVVVSRRVMCYHRLSGILVGSTWSDDNGDYIITGLIAGVKYFITSIDSNNDAVQYNAVTQDLIAASEVV